MDFDVVVVGSGAGGLAAALSAAEAGADVLVAEAEAEIGGSSRLSRGQLMAAGTRMQRRLGIDDSAEDFYRYYMTINQWRLDNAVIRRFCYEAGPVVDWLEDLGVTFSDRMRSTVLDPIPRGHSPASEGAGIVDVLHAACRRAQVDFAMGRRVDRLLVEDGRVVGVAVGGDEVTAGAVVVATGGFGNNPELLARYSTDYVKAGDWAWYIGADGSRGDHMSFADQVGAQIAYSLPAQFLATPNFFRAPEISLPGWLIMVDDQGRRFVDETTSYNIVERIMKQQSGPVFAVFDDAAKRAATRSRSHQAGTGKWIDDVIDEYVASGTVLRAESLTDLADAIGVPHRNLEGTIAHYNADVARGQDSMFLKPPDQMVPISTAPYYATEIRLAHIGHTDVGFRIDPEARVLAESSLPIPGLFACGECTGNVIGSVYVGSGNSYGNAVVYGRIAGRAAATESRAASTA